MNWDINLIHKICNQIYHFVGYTVAFLFKKCLTLWRTYSKYDLLCFTSSSSIKEFLKSLINSYGKSKYLEYLFNKELSKSVLFFLIGRINFVIILLIFHSLSYLSYSLSYSKSGISSNPNYPSIFFISK